MNEKEIIQSLIDKGYKRKEIAKILNISFDSLKYKFKKYSLKVSKVFLFKCTSCNVTKTDKDFYYKKIEKRYHTSCKICMSQKTVEKQQQIKQLALEYKGNCCQICNYNKCVAALEFHHLDPTKKDIKWKNFKLRTFDDDFKKELDKCLLVCSNCHREIHHCSTN